MNTAPSHNQLIEANFSVKLSNPLRSAGAPRFELVIDELLAARGVTAVFGPSGCGKTTLLQTGQRPQQSGFAATGWSKNRGDPVGGKLLINDKLKARRCCRTQGI